MLFEDAAITATSLIFSRPNEKTFSWAHSVS